MAVAELELAKEDGDGRRLPNERERKRLLAAFDASGLTQRVFARQEGINYFTFAGWLRQRRLKSGQVAVAARPRMPAVPMGSCQDRGQSRRTWGKRRV